MREPVRLWLPPPRVRIAGRRDPLLEELAAPPNDGVFEEVADTLKHPHGHWGDQQDSS